jgi:hypothetical protein
MDYLLSYLAVTLESLICGYNNSLCVLHDNNHLYNGM